VLFLAWECLGVDMFISGVTMAMHAHCNGTQIQAVGVFIVRILIWMMGLIP